MVKSKRSRRSERKKRRDSHVKKVDRPSSNDDEKSKFGPQIVCLLDLLGQKQKLHRLNNISKDTPESEFGIAIRETAGIVDNFEQNYLNIFNHKTPMIPEFETILKKDPRVRDAYLRMKDSEIKTQQFSDTFIFYSALTNLKNDVSIYTIYRILTACCIQMWTWLACGVPFRGGVAIGNGVFHKNGRCYGPTLAEAYFLENEIAGYPRIVVSEELISLLNNQQLSDDSNINTGLQGQVRLCRNVLVKDTDGHWVVNYLGEGYWDLIKSSHILSDAKEDCVRLFKAAYSFVVDESKRFRQEKNYKLAGRYAQLEYYFEKNKDRWLSLKDV